MRMPSLTFLFGMFWTYTTLRRIVIETNRYAMEEDEDGNVSPNCGKKNWKLFSILELRAFIGN